MAKRQVGLFSVMSAPKPKRGRESEEGLSVSEEVTFDATNDPSVSELEDLRVEDENEVGTSETALDTIPGGCLSQCGVQPNDKYTEIIEYKRFHGLVQLVRRYLAITVNTLPRDKLLIFSKYAETMPIIYATAISS